MPVTWMRAFKRTTIPSDPDKVFADLIGRNFTSDTPGTKLVVDTACLRACVPACLRACVPACLRACVPACLRACVPAYLRTGEGWLYLATVIDLCTRMVVDWAPADHMRASLVTGALAMARDGGHLAPDAIFHSDRGTQAVFNRSSQHRRIGVSGYRGIG